MRLRLFVLLGLLSLALVVVGETLRPHGLTPTPPEFAPPELLLDASEHANRLYPHFADFDGDGTTDLLVGVGDRLQIHRNQGTNSRPNYAKPIWFDSIEPSARIPSG